MNDRNTIRKAKFEINCENIQDFSQRLTESFITWYFWSIVANFSSDIFKVEPFQFDLIRFFAGLGSFARVATTMSRMRTWSRNANAKIVSFENHPFLQVFDSWIELRTKSFSASFSCYSVPYNSEITLKILSCTSSGKVSDRSASDTVGGKSQWVSPPKPLLGWKFWPKIWTSHFGQKF